MPKIEKNTYRKINDEIMELKITRRDGSEKYCLFDTEDYDKVKSHVWHYTAKGYIKTQTPDGQKAMAEIIIHPRDKTKNFIWDHRNGDKANNQKKNLRHISWKMNIANRHKFYTNNCYGISLTKAGTYRTRNKDGKQKTYPTFVEALQGRFEFLMAAGLSKGECLHRYGFDNEEEWDFMLNLCREPAD